MSYHPNIPQATDDPTVSQSQLLDNFGKMNTDFAINHVALTAGGNNGFHKLVQFTNVLASDPVVTGVQSAVYPKNVDGSPQLFFNNVTQVYPLTGLRVINGTITFITKAINAQVTSAGHSLSMGDTVTISDVLGMVEINGGPYTVTAIIDADNFQINVNSTGFTNYASGGVWTSPDSTRFGFITPWGWTINCGQFTISSGSTINVFFSIPYVMGFDLYTALLTPTAGVTQYGVVSVDPTFFQAITSTVPRTFYYLVIGTT